MKIISLIIILAALVIGLFVLIWAISELWSTEAIYDFWNWLAGFAIIALLGRTTDTKPKE